MTPEIAVGKAPGSAKWMDLVYGLRGEGRPLAALDLLREQVPLTDYQKAMHAILSAGVLSDLGDARAAEMTIRELTPPMESGALRPQVVGKLERKARSVEVRNLQDASRIRPIAESILKSLEETTNDLDRADLLADLGHLSRLEGKLVDSRMHYQKAIRIWKNPMAERAVPPWLNLEYAQTLMCRGDLELAWSILNEVRRQADAEGLQVFWKIRLDLLTAILEMVRERLPECERNLVRTSRFIEAEAVRNHAVWTMIAAQLKLARGEPSVAMELLNINLMELGERAPGSDLIPTLKRHLALALLELSPAEALPLALEALESNRNLADSRELISRLRTVCKCSLRVEDYATARDALAKIDERYPSIEFAMERESVSRLRGRMKNIRCSDVDR